MLPYEAPPMQPSFCDSLLVFCIVLPDSVLVRVADHRRRFTARTREEERVSCFSRELLSRPLECRRTCSFKIGESSLLVDWVEVPGRGPPNWYGCWCVAMCQRMVASRRITATRAIFAPRRLLIRRYQFFIHRSRRNTCITIWPSWNRARLLPCLVIEPSRSVASPELRHDGVKPQ